MVIEKKKRDFTLVEDEIDRLIEDQEARERLIAQRDSKDEDDYDDDDNDDDEEDEPQARSSRDKGLLSLLHLAWFFSYEKNIPRLVCIPWLFFLSLLTLILIFFTQILAADLFLIKDIQITTENARILESVQKQRYQEE